MNESMIIWCINLWQIFYLSFIYWSWLVYSCEYTWECLCLKRHKNIEYLMQHITMNESMIQWFISVRWINFLTNWLVYFFKYIQECLCPNGHKNIEYLMQPITKDKLMIVWFIISTDDRLHALGYWYNLVDNLLHPRCISTDILLHSKCILTDYDLFEMDLLVWDEFFSWLINDEVD